MTLDDVIDGVAGGGGSSAWWLGREEDVPDDL